MKDIVKAIEKEKEYLEYRKKGQEPYHLADAIKKLGFEDLREYFDAKKEYNFKSLQFEVIETTPLRAITDVINTIKQEKTAVLFAITPFTLIWNGNNSTFNEEYCNRFGFPILPLQTGGGTIVSTRGDLNIGICFPRKMEYTTNYILEGLANIFRKYTNKKVEVDGNDILVDGYKVLGSSVYADNKMFMFITPVSLSEKSELINNICLKKSSKVAGYVDFMDAEILKSEVCEWLQIK